MNPHATVAAPAAVNTTRSLRTSVTVRTTVAQHRFYRPEPFDDRVGGFDADDLDLDFVLEDFVDGLDVFDDADEEDARLLRLTFLLESERMACSVLRCVLVSTASSSFILADSNSASSCSSAVIFL